MWISSASLNSTHANPFLCPLTLPVIPCPCCRHCPMQDVCCSDVIPPPSLSSGVVDSKLETNSYPQAKVFLRAVDWNFHLSFIFSLSFNVRTTVVKQFRANQTGSWAPQSSQRIAPRSCQARNPTSASWFKTAPP